MRSTIFAAVALTLSCSSALAQRGVLSRVQHKNGSQVASNIPAQYRGLWSPSMRKCKEEYPEESGALRIAAKEISGFEANFKFERVLSVAKNKFAFRGVESAEGDGGTSRVTVSLSMVGNRLLVSSTSGLKYNLVSCARRTT